MQNSNNIHGIVNFKRKLPVKGDIQINATWIIPNFLKLVNDNTIGDVTTEKPSAEGQVQFRIVFTKARANIDISYLSPKILYLQSVQVKTCTFNTDSWIHEEDVCIRNRSGRHIVEPNIWYHLDTILNRISYLRNFGESKVMHLMKDGSFCIKFEFVITIGKKEEPFQFPASQLPNDLGKLFLQGIYSDLVMTSSDHEEFKVHKAVLATRSSVLKAHFDHNTVESVSNIVKSPLDSEVLHEVLVFIYTDQAPRVDEIPELLLVAADYYQLDRLKSLCEEALYKKLSIDNAIEILQLANLHSANTLKKLTLDFIKDGRQSAVIKTEGWKKLESFDLMKIIFEASFAYV